jgi:hypothetical protein
MTLRRRLLASLVLLVAIAAGSAAAQARQNPAGGLTVTLRPKASAFSARDIPIDVVFQNNGDETVEILYGHEQVPLQAFLGFRVTGERGHLVLGRGFPAIQWLQDMLYVRVLPHQTFTLTARLEQFLSQELTPGEYNVSAMYRNPYGKLFTVETNKIVLRIQ